MQKLDSLPRWDMTPIFPSLESPEFATAFAEAKRAVQSLVPLFDSHEVRRTETDAPIRQRVQAFEIVTARLNEVLQAMQTLRSYLGAFVATDAGNDTAQSLLSELRVAGVTLRQLQLRYIAWVGSTDAQPTSFSGCWRT